ncbi:MAG: hypothetical protein COA78_29335 [Blastopirellula sp.]|nr:MAG: hypothetical protein COA78_29335 [Blastopirellula sp.]
MKEETKSKPRPSRSKFVALSYDDSAYERCPGCGAKAILRPCVACQAFERNKQETAIKLLRISAGGKLVKLEPQPQLHFKETEDMAEINRRRKPK